MGQLFDRSVSAAIAPVQAQMNSMQSVLLALAAGSSGAGGGSALPRNTPEASPRLQRYGGWKYFADVDKFRRVPATFRFPDSTAENLLQHWFIGSEILQVPPLEMLDVNDVNWQVRGDGKLRDARALVKAVVDEAKSQGLWGNGKHTAVDLRRIYHQCRDNLGITGNITNSWQTALKQLRKKKSGGNSSKRRSAASSSAQKRNRTVNNTGRVDCNPHHRNKRPTTCSARRSTGSGGGAAGTGLLLRSRGERMVAQGLEALAPAAGTTQAAIRQVQGQSFVDSIVGANAGASAGGCATFTTGNAIEHV